jgi:flagellar basal-body rod protein FlgB
MSLEQIRPKLVADPTPATRSDGNNVDIEVEMGELAKNTLEYESAAKLLSHKVRMLQTVISGK